MTIGNVTKIMKNQKQVKKLHILMFSATDSGHHLMHNISGSGGITKAWKQQLVGVSGTGGISWKKMKNMKIGKVTKDLKNNKQGNKLLFSEIFLTL